MQSGPKEGPEYTTNEELLNKNSTVELQKFIQHECFFYLVWALNVYLKQPIFLDYQKAHNASFKRGDRVVESKK